MQRACLLALGNAPSMELVAIGKFEALEKIAEDPEVAGALFEILETQRLVHGQAEITLLPENRELMSDLLAIEAKPRVPVPRQQ